MGITAPKLQSLGFVDQLIEEPLGAAHRNHEQIAKNLKAALVAGLNNLKALPVDELVESRYQRLTSYDRFL